jgi:hypothetical protein
MQVFQLNEAIFCQKSQRWLEMRSASLARRRRACFSRIKPLSLLSSGGTSTLRRYFGQQTTWYLPLDTMVLSRCNSYRESILIQNARSIRP